MVKTTISKSNETTDFNYPMLVNDVFQKMVYTYKRMFCSKNPFCPVIPNANGKLAFPERNLTFNFCNEYLNLAEKSNGDEIIVWQELDVKNNEGNKSRGHIDSVIIDMRPNISTVLLIEAKRIAAGNAKKNGKSMHKCEALRQDMGRLAEINFHNNPNGSWNVSNELFELIRDNKLTVCKMALVDYWEWNNKSNHWKEDFVKCSGNQFEKINEQPIHEGIYYLNYCLNV